MRKWLFAGLLVPGLALAMPPEEIGGESGQERGQTQQQSAGSQSGAVLGQDVGTSGREQVGTPSQQGGIELSVEDSYKVKGKIASVDPENNEITLQREADEPNVSLKVAEGALIERNGKQIAIYELEPGDEVRARFDLAGDQPFAVELKSKGKK